MNLRFLLQLMYPIYEIWRCLVILCSRFTLIIFKFSNFEKNIEVTFDNIYKLLDVKWRCKNFLIDFSNTQTKFHFSFWLNKFLFKLLDKLNQIHSIFLFCFVCKCIFWYHRMFTDSVQTLVWFCNFSMHVAQEWKVFEGIKCLSHNCVLGIMAKSRLNR